MALMTSLPPNYRALVIGSNGSIGSAFVQSLALDPSCAAVEQLSRATTPGFDLNNEQSVEDSLAPFKAQGGFDLIIDATGALVLKGVGPEKSLNALKASTFDEALWVNCIGPTVMLKNLVPLLKQNRCIYAKLSARVGSISDNKLGGWYSYRASKAAFNMVLQTAAIEHHRKNPQSIFVALQPGTVASKLSAPFVAQSKTLTPQDSVLQMLASLDQLTPSGRAQFIDYKGAPIAW